MKTLSQFALLFLSTILLSACGKSDALRGQKAYSEGALILHQATVGVGQIHLQFKFQNRDFKRTARWSVSSADAQTHKHFSAFLSLPTPELNHESSAAGKAVALLKRKDWLDIRAEILESITPSASLQGVQITGVLANAVSYRNADGLLRIEPFGEQPDAVQVVGLFDTEDFFLDIFTHLRRLQSKDNLPPRLLVPLGQPTMEQIQYLYFDLESSMTVLLLDETDPQLAAHSLLLFPIEFLNTTILNGHIISALKNPVTVVARLVSLTGTSSYALASSGLSVRKAPPPVANNPPMNLDRWSKQLDQLVASKPRLARVEILIDGRRFFPRLIREILAASQSVFMRVYIFDNDDFATSFADIVKSRARELDLKVLMDRLGSLVAGRLPPETAAPPGFEPPASIAAYLQLGAKTKVRQASNPWLTADHNKIFLIDEKIAYLGGMNIGREYRSEWHDMMVRLEGPLVGKLVRQFRAAWAHAGVTGDLGYLASRLTHRAYQGPKSDEDMIPVRLLHTATGRFEIYRAQLAAIRNAKSYIYLQNAYLANTDIVNALIRARHRGVDVRVVFPARNNSGLMDANNALVASALFDSGVKVYLYPGMSHVKAAIYDGWACLGSANFDKLSLLVNQETNIAFDDHAAVAALKSDLFEVDFAASELMSNATKPNWSDQFIGFLTNQL